MEFRETLLTIWFFISPFIILHLCLKLRGIRNLGENVLEKIQEGWDKEYKNIINQFGSTKNFMSLVTEDFRNVRKTGASYLGIYKASLEKIFSLCKVNSNMTKQDLINVIDDISLISSFSEHEADDYLNFLISEEKLHDFEVKLEEYYNKIKAREFEAFEMRLVQMKDNNKSDKK